tara:strand:+ start:3061 stop:3489 length:429 start_codon:yes stop_codon:yes gene_type:complete
MTGHAHADRRNVAVTADLHPRVYGVTAVAWIWLFGAFWIAFGGEAEGAFVLGVDMVFLAAFFGTPWMLKRITDRFNARQNPQTPPAAPQGSLEDFLEGDFETLNGSTSGWSALVQIAIVPVGLALFMTCLAVILAVVRAPYH